MGGLGGLDTTFATFCKCTKIDKKVAKVAKEVFNFNFINIYYDRKNCSISNSYEEISCIHG